MFYEKFHILYFGAFYRFRYGMDSGSFLKTHVVSWCICNGLCTMNRLQLFNYSLLYYFKKVFFLILSTSIHIIQAHSIGYTIQVFRLFGWGHLSVFDFIKIVNIWHGQFDFLSELGVGLGRSTVHPLGIINFFKFLITSIFKFSIKCVG